MAVRSPHPTPNRVRLADDLIAWAVLNFPAAALAYDESTDRDFRGRCLASIVRRRADADFPWLVRTAEEQTKELAALGDLIGSAGGYPHKGMTFSEWVEATALIAGV